MTIAITLHAAIAKKTNPGMNETLFEQTAARATEPTSEQIFSTSAVMANIEPINISESNY